LADEIGRFKFRSLRVSEAGGRLFQGGNALTSSMNNLRRIDPHSMKHPAAWIPAWEGFPVNRFWIYSRQIVRF
jgi:hypothetical protein